MTEATMRPTIFLYTNAALIDARTKKAMIAAGFLPVKVATLDAVQFLEPAPVVPVAEVGEILRAALDAIANATGHVNTFKSDVQQHFARSLAARLIRAADRKPDA